MKEITCDLIWERVVRPVYEKMNETHGGLLCPDCEKRTFKTHYEEVLGHAKEHYMSDPNNPLNRHKVAAALIAILKTKPIKK